jgi:hypothetical protein
MGAKTTVLEGEHFNICWGVMSPNTKIKLVLRNLKDPDSLHGQITQWLWGSEGDCVLEFLGKDKKIQMDSGELFKVPELYNNRIAYHAGKSGVSWVSFNPKPHTDQYFGKQINLNKDQPFDVEIESFERFLVLLSGKVYVTSDKVSNIPLDRTSTIKIKPGSKITLVSTVPSTVGIFNKVSEK